MKFISQGGTSFSRWGLDLRRKQINLSMSILQQSLPALYRERLCRKTCIVGATHACTVPNVCPAQSGRLVLESNAQYVAIYEDM